MLNDYLKLEHNIKFYFFFKRYFCTLRTSFCRPDPKIYILREYLSEISDLKSSLTLFPSNEEIRARKRCYYAESEGWGIQELIVGEIIFS